jgi:hypothetical protein
VSDDVVAQSHFQQRGRLDYHLAVYDECGIYPTIIYGYLERWVWIGSKTGKGAFPSHETLSKQSGISVRSVVAALNELREKGWIDWARTGSSNRYVLTDKIGRSAPDAERDESSARNDAQDVQNRSAPDADELLRANTLSSPPLSPTETSPQRGKAQRASRLSDDWKPTPEEAQYAVDLGLDPEETAEDFRLYWLGNGRTMVSWHATFQRWCRTEAQRRRGKPVRSNGTAPHDASDPDWQAWMIVVKAKEHLDTTGEMIKAPTDAIRNAVKAIGGIRAIEPSNSFQRRDFLAAHKAERIGL